MAMLGRKLYNPNAYVPVGIGSPEPPKMLSTPSLDAVAPIPQIAPQKTGPNWMGIVADALSGLAGGPGIYAPRAFAEKQRQAEETYAENQWQSHHRQELADQMALLDYKRKNPDDELTQYLDLAGIKDPAQRATYYRQKADAMTAPPMMSAQGVDEQGKPVMRFFPRAQALPPSSAPAPTVGTVKNGYRFKGGNPASPDAWEQIGGQTPSASGGFQ